jgi:hypothetical protein
MIDKHAVQQMLTAGVRIGVVARYFEVSRRTIERIRKEPAVEGAEGAVARWKRGVVKLLVHNERPSFSSIDPNTPTCRRPSLRRQPRR